MFVLKYRLISFNFYKCEWSVLLKSYAVSKETSELYAICVGLNMGQKIN